MATYDHSFHAEGDDPPRLVAFETVAPSPERVHSFGVAVYAKQCGVNALGVSLATLATMGTDPHIVGAPVGVGVRGLGDLEGVQGEGPIGVRGLGKVPGTLGGSGVGVQGEGGAFGVNGLGTVAGVHGSGIIGVQGDGGGTGVEGKGPVGVRGVGQNAVSGGTTGVEGSGDIGVRGSGRFGVQGEGHVGVFGQSDHNRAGVFLTGRTDLPPLKKFDSEPSAQLLLVPVQVNGAVTANLPRNGLAGDLLAVVSTDRKDPAAELWFCIRGGSADPAQPGATWGQVQFATTVTVP